MGAMRLERSLSRIAGLAGLAAGLLIRVGLVVRSSGIEPTSDMRDYLDLAGVLAAGAPLVQVDRALLYPAALAALMRVGLDSLLGIYLLQSLSTLAAAVILAGLARRWLGVGWGWAMLMTAPSLTVAQYSGLLLSESLFLPLFALWALLILRPSTRLGASAAAGACAALACAARPAAIPLALGTAMVLVLKGRPARRSAIVFSAAAGAVWTAWLACFPFIAEGRVATVPTAGVNLYLGNHAEARGDGGGVPRMPPRLAAIEDPSERNALAGREALAYMATHPLRTAWLALVRAVRLAGVNPGRVETDALASYGLGRAAAAGWLVAEWLGLVAMATVALRLDSGLRRPAIEAAWILAPYVAVLLFTFVQTRFRLPLHALLLPFAARGLELVARMGPGAAWREARPGLPLALFALVAALSLLPR